MALKSRRAESWIKEKLISYRVLTAIMGQLSPAIPCSKLNNNKSKVNKQKLGKTNCDH